MTLRNLFTSAKTKQEIQAAKIDMLFRCGVLKEKYPNFKAAIEEREKLISGKQYNANNIHSEQNQFTIFETEIVNEVKCINLLAKAEEKLQEEEKSLAHQRALNQKQKEIDDELYRLKALLKKPFALPEIDESHPTYYMIKNLKYKNDNELSEALIEISGTPITELRLETLLPGEMHGLIVSFFTVSVDFCKLRNQVFERINLMRNADEYGMFLAELKPQELKAYELLNKIKKYDFAMVLQKKLLKTARDVEEKAKNTIFSDLDNCSADKDQLSKDYEEGKYCPAGKHCITIYHGNTSENSGAFSSKEYETKSNDIPPAIINQYNLVKKERLAIRDMIFKINEDTASDKLGISISQKIYAYKDKLLELDKTLNENPVAKVPKTPVISQTAATPAAKNANGLFSGTSNNNFSGSRPTSTSGYATTGYGYW